MLSESEVKTLISETAGFAACELIRRLVYLKFLNNKGLLVLLVHLITLLCVESGYKYSFSPSRPL